MKSPPLSFSVDSEYLIDNIQVVVHSFDERTGQVRLRNPLSNARMDFSTPELAVMRMNGKLVVLGDARPKYEPKFQPTLKRLTRVQSRFVARRVAYAQGSVHLYPVGPLSARLRAAIDEVAARINDTRPPSPHSVYRWVRRLVLSNYDTAVFLQDAGAIRQRKPRIEPGAEELLRKQIQSLLSRSKDATLNGVMNEALALVAKELSHVTFISKEGDELLIDEYLALRQRRREQPTSQEKRRVV